MLKGHKLEECQVLIRNSVKQNAKNVASQCRQSNVQNYIARCSDTCLANDIATRVKSCGVAKTLSSL